MKKRGFGYNCVDDMFYLRDSLIWKIEHEKLNLEQRIDNAIKYIEENCIDDEFYINLTRKEKEIIKVLDILKGSDKNVKD